MAKQPKSYTEAIREIEEIVSLLNEENISVDMLTEKVQHAAELIDFCKQKLQKTNEEVQKILDKIEA